MEPDVPTGVLSALNRGLFFYRFAKYGWTSAGVIGAIDGGSRIVHGEWIGIIETLVGSVFAISMWEEFKEKIEGTKIAKRDLLEKLNSSFQKTTMVTRD